MAMFIFYDLIFSFQSSCFLSKVTYVKSIEERYFIVFIFRLFFTALHEAFALFASPTIIIVSSFFIFIFIFLEFPRFTFILSSSVIITFAFIPTAFLAITIFFFFNLIISFCVPFTKLAFSLVFFSLTQLFYPSISVILALFFVFLPTFSVFQPMPI